MPLVGALALAMLPGIARATVECTLVQEFDMHTSALGRAGTVRMGTIKKIEPFHDACGTLTKVRIEYLTHPTNEFQWSVGATNNSSDTPSSLSMSVHGLATLSAADLNIDTNISNSGINPVPWPAGSFKSYFSGAFVSGSVEDATPAAQWTGASPINLDFEFSGGYTVSGSPSVPFTVQQDPDFEFNEFHGGKIRVTYTYTGDNSAPTITVTGTGGDLGCNPTSDQIDAATAATATDNCPNVTLSASDSKTTDGCKVSLTRTWTAKDNCGQTTQVDAPVVTFTVDTQGPDFALTGQDGDLGCNPSAQQIDEALGTWVDNSFTDNCPGKITLSDPITSDVTGADCHKSQSRSFTAKDACGNPTTKKVTVTWTVDREGPDIQLTGTTDALGCNPTKEQIEAALGTVTIVDCSGVLSQGSTDEAGGSGCAHSLKRTWTATDNCTNQSSVSHTVTWSVSGDAPTPVIKVTGTADPGCNPTAAQIDAAFGTASTSGGCGDVTLHSSDGSVSSDGCARTQTRTWTASDACGTPATSVSATIHWNVDAQGPTLSAVTATPASLWPPNHTMRDVVVAYTATDGCGNAGITNTLSVTSNEPINGTGDGDTSPDWEIVDATHVRLRAERAGTGNGRIYTITLTSKDGCGNSSTATVPVVVAHNITGPVSGASFKVGTTVSFAGTFWDVANMRHTAQWTFDNLSTAGIVVESSGLKPGTAAGKYTFAAAGVYKVALNLTDQNGVTSSVNTAGDLEAITVIYDPGAGYTIGGGWYASPAGAYAAKPTVSGKASFGFTSKYFKGASNPRGELQFEFKQAGIEFNALNYDYLVIAGAKAQFKGTGKLTGDGALYNFILTVIDGQLAGGGGTDKIRMKITNKSGAVVYDSERGISDAANPTLPVGAGSSVVITNTTLVAGPATSEPNPGDETPNAAATVHAFALTAVRPNPFRTTTELEYALPVRSNVELSVYDIRGARVRMLVDEVEGPGVSSARFDANGLDAGVYFVRMRARSVDDPERSFSQVRKILMVK